MAFRSSSISFSQPNTWFQLGTLRDVFVSLRCVVMWLSDVQVFADSRRTAAAAVMSMPVAA